MDDVARYISSAGRLCGGRRKQAGTSRPVVKAELAYTDDSGLWKEREWKTVSATISGNTITATLPSPIPTCYHMLLIDERGLPVSSPIEIP